MKTSPYLFFFLGAFSGAYLFSVFSTSPATEHLDYQALKNKNLELSKLNATLENELSGYKRLVTEVGNTETAAPTSDDDSILKKRIAELENALKNDSPLVSAPTQENVGALFKGDYSDYTEKVSRIAEDFNSDSAHYPEAEAAEERLLQSFEGHEGLADFDFGNPQCKGTTCRFQMAALDTFQESEMIHSLNKAFSPQGDFADNTYLLVPDKNNGITSLYIGKEGESFSTH